MQSHRRWLLPTHIGLDIDQWKLGVLTHRVRQVVDAVLALAQHTHLGIIAHEIPWQHKGSRHTSGPDILLHLGFLVKMGYMFEPPAGCLGDIKQGGENQMLDAGCLCCVGRVLAMHQFCI